MQIPRTNLKVKYKFVIMIQLHLFLTRLWFCTINGDFRSVGVFFFKLTYNSRCHFFLFLLVIIVWWVWLLWRVPFRLNRDPPSHSVIACNYSPHVATVCKLWKDGQSELEKHVWTLVNSKMCAQFKRQENVQNAQSFLHSWVFLVASHYLTSWPVAPPQAALPLLFGFRFLSFLLISQHRDKCRGDPLLIYCMYCPIIVIVKLN